MRKTQKRLGKTPDKDEISIGLLFYCVFTFVFKFVVLLFRTPMVLPVRKFVTINPSNNALE